MIVRLMGEGQFEIDDEVAKGLHGLDEQAAEAVRTNGTRVPDDDLSASEGIVPPDDLSLEEARQLFEGEGLIPDLPARP